MNDGGKLCIVCSCPMQLHQFTFIGECEGPFCDDCGLSVLEQLWIDRGFMALATTIRDGKIHPTDVNRCLVDADGHFPEKWHYEMVVKYKEGNYEE